MMLWRIKLLVSVPERVYFANVRLWLKSANDVLYAVYRIPGFFVASRQNRQCCDVKLLAYCLSQRMLH